MRVAGVGLGAALAALPGAGRAAAAAVRHQADSQRAARRGPRALARPPAELATCGGLCRGWDGAGHGEGGLGSGLQAKEHSLDGVTEKWGLQTLRTRRKRENFLSKREHNENLFYSLWVFSAGEKSQMNSPKHITSLADATWAAQASWNCPANVTQL